MVLYIGLDILLKWDCFYVWRWWDVFKNLRWFGKVKDLFLKVYGIGLKGLLEERRKFVCVYIFWSLLWLVKYMYVELIWYRL